MMNNDEENLRKMVHHREGRPCMYSRSVRSSCDSAHSVAFFFEPHPHSAKKRLSVPLNFTFMFFFKWLLGAVLLYTTRGQESHVDSGCSVNEATTTSDLTVQLLSIDLRSTLTNDTVAKVRIALEAHGAFMLTNADMLTIDFVSEVNSVVTGFFDQPLSQKELLRVNGTADPRGYSGFEEENVYAFQNQEGPADPVEKLSFGVSNNVWPQQPSSFQPLLIAYMEGINALSLSVFHILAAALNVPSDYFDQFLSSAQSSLRCLNYPPVPSPKPRQLRMAPHTDAGVFTIVQSDNIPGSLEYFIDGQWQKLAHLNGAFIVQIGDTMRKWTNNRWVSPLHRVGLPPSEIFDEWARRQSLVYFQMVNFDALIEPLFETSNGTDQAESFIFGDFLAEKMGKMSDGAS